MNKGNKFKKRLVEFYLEPISSKSLKKVKPSTFRNYGKELRTSKVHEFTRQIHERREKSLLNIDSLSKVLQVQQKVFRTSASFIDPQKACLNQRKIRLTSFLKSHILQKDQENSRKARFTQKQSIKQKPKNLSISNYCHFSHFTSTNSKTKEKEIAERTECLNLHRRKMKMPLKSQLSYKQLHFEHHSHENL